MDSAEVQRFFDVFGEWAESKFGEGQPLNAPALKLIEEAEELANEPTKITELADCLGCIAHQLKKSGFTLQDAIEAGWAKLEINKTREFTRNPDGTYSGSSYENKALPIAPGAINGNSHAETIKQLTEVLPVVAKMRGNVLRALLVKPAPRKFLSVLPAGIVPGLSRENEEAALVIVITPERFLPVAETVYNQFKMSVK